MTRDHYDHRDAATVRQLAARVPPLGVGAHLERGTEPAERVVVAATRAGVPLAVPRPGQSVAPSEPPAVGRWGPEQPWPTAEQAPVVSSGL